MHGVVAVVVDGRYARKPATYGTSLVTGGRASRKGPVAAAASAAQFGAMIPAVARRHD